MLRPRPEGYRPGSALPEPLPERTAESSVALTVDAVEGAPREPTAAVVEPDAPEGAVPGVSDVEPVVATVDEAVSDVDRLIPCLLGRDSERLTQIDGKKLDHSTACPSA